MASNPYLYQSQGTAKTMPLPGGGGRGFGAETVAGIDALGDAVGAAASTRFRAVEQEKDADLRIAQEQDRQAKIEQARKRSAEAAERAAALETSRGELAGRFVEMRAKAGPGALDHETQVDELVHDWTTTQMSGLTDPELIDRFRPVVAATAAQLKLSEKTWAVGQRADKNVNDIETLEAALSASMATDPSDENLALAVAKWNVAIDAALLPGNAKEELRLKGFKSFKVSGWQAAAASNPDGAIEALDGGRLNDVASGEEIVRLRAYAVSIKERNEAKARAAAAAAVSEFSEAARVDLDDVNKGVRVDPARLEQIRANAVAAGEKDLAKDAEEAIVKVRTIDRFTGASSAELVSAQRGIEQKPKWRESRENVIAHDVLDTLIENTKAKAKNDLLSLWSENGGKLAPVNLADPASMNGRFAQGDAAHRRYGGTRQYLTDEEAAPLRERFENGSVAERSAIIQNFASYGADRGGVMMRQIAPGDARTAALLSLATARNRAPAMQLVRRALSGWEQMKANPKLAEGFNANRMQQDVDRQYGPALSMIDGGLRQGAMEVAKGLYADAAIKQGVAGFSEELWRKSYRQAWAEVGDGTGGFGRAADGSAMLLPKGMSEADVEVPLARATGEDIMSSAVGGRTAPQWGGKDMSPADFKKLIPVMRVNGIYAFRTRGGEYVTSAKNPAEYFLLSISELAKRTRK